MNSDLLTWSPGQVTITPQGSTFTKKALGPARFSHKLKVRLISEKQEKFVPSQNNFGHVGNPSVHNDELCTTVPPSHYLILFQPSL